MLDVPLLASVSKFCVYGMPIVVRLMVPAAEDEDSRMIPTPRASVAASTTRPILKASGARRAARLLLFCFVVGFNPNGGIESAEINPFFIFVGAVSSTQSVARDRPDSFS